MKDDARRAGRPPVPGPRGAEAVLDKIAARLEEMNLGAYVDLYRHPWRMLWLNFSAGLARGLGMAVGFTLLGALVIYLLGASAVHHLPVIGHFIAQIVRIVEQEMRAARSPAPAP